MNSRVDALEKRVVQLERRAGGNVAAVGAAGPAAPPTPRRPPVDPAAVYHVPIHQDDGVRGPRQAKVTIVEAFDFACPYCALTAPAIDEVAGRYPNDVRVVTRQVIVHPDTATLPALAVCAARKQGKGHEMQKKIWDTAWTLGDKNPKVDHEKLKQPTLDALAGQLQLDLARFHADIATPECRQSIDRDQRDMAAIGITGTPAFFINGRRYTGPRTAAGFDAMVKEELTKAEAALRAGGRAEDYYDSLMKTARRGP